MCHQHSLLCVVLQANAQTLARVMLASLDIKPQENYGARLLRFTKYCNALKVPATQCVLAPEIHLSTFAASWAGKVLSLMGAGWLAEIHFWHSYQGASWNGGNMLRISSNSIKKLVPDSYKHAPVTLAHMHALITHLTTQALVMLLGCHMLTLLCLAFLLVWGPADMHLISLTSLLPYLHMLMYQ